MSKRREVEGRIEALNEIHNIMESMKNISMMEMHKLIRYQGTQQRVVDSIGHALNEVRRHYAPEPMQEDTQPVYLLFGSERGFCGAYNDQLLNVLAQQPGHKTAPLIGVGARLAAPLQHAYPHAICLPGATVADEVGAVLTRVVATLNSLRQEQDLLRIEVIYYQADTLEPQCLPVLPPLEETPLQGVAPLINLHSQQLIGELLEHYLFVLTHAWLLAALISENQLRVRHMDQAGHHLERQLEKLGKRRNVLRQEEIIEEIEVILLSSESASSSMSRI